MSHSESNETLLEVDKNQEVPRNSKDLGDMSKPFVGMMFNSMEEAREYYTEFGRLEGYTIRTRSTNKARRGNEITCAKFVCSCEGIHQKKSQEKDMGNSKKYIIRRSRSTVRDGCSAYMRVMNIRGTTQWQVTGFSDDHNHRLVTPSKMIHMSSNRCMPEAARDLTECFNRENLQVGKLPSIFGGGYSTVGFDDRDCWNHLKAMRHKDLESGDAHAVVTYFRKKQAENPHFFYAIQCDDNGRATNFFWVDARSRMSYEQFGDVVAFDTTYRTNKYSMPFAPFTGVNHHFQSILFGCALLQDESEVTFVWLFETWLEAMGGRHPLSIITDQDLAIGRAVARVFPNSRHRYCLWHIMKKFAEKLAHVYFKKSKFKQSIKKCVHSTYTSEEFEDQWNSLILEFDLTENDWLKNLYEIRYFWIPAYNRNIFFAGMNTTGRSESINSFFDGFVSSKTNLRDFVAKYEQALDKIYARERKEDYISIYKKRILNTISRILNHAADIYTRNIFEKFRCEFDEVCRYKIDGHENDGQWCTFNVITKFGLHEKFNVKINLETKEATCGCQHFEFTGIICRHLLKVFDRLDIDEIPNHFIMKRWTKEANRREMASGDALFLHDRQMGSEVMRISHICRRSTQLAYIAGKSEETYKVVIGLIDEGFKKVSLIEQELLKNENNDETLNEICENSKGHDVTQASTLGSTTQTILLDPHISQTKGRKRTETGRWKSSIEIASKKLRRCKLCGGQGHDSRNCPINPKKKRAESCEPSMDDEAMNLGSDDSSGFSKEK